MQWVLESMESNYAAGERTAAADFFLYVSALLSISAAVCCHSVHLATSWTYVMSAALVQYFAAASVGVRALRSICVMMIATQQRNNSAYRVILGSLGMLLFKRFTILQRS